MLVPDAVNQRWSMDFVADQLANGRRFRVLNVVDDFSREYVLKVVDFSISGHRVARVLDRIARNLPINHRLRQRTGVYIEGVVLLGEESQCEAALHPARETDTKRVRREFQRQDARVLSRHELVRQHRGREINNR